MYNKEIGSLFLCGEESRYQAEKASLKKWQRRLQPEGWARVSSMRLRRGLKQKEEHEQRSWGRNEVDKCGIWMLIRTHSPSAMSALFTCL